MISTSQHRPSSNGLTSNDSILITNSDVDDSLDVRRGNRRRGGLGGFSWKKILKPDVRIDTRFWPRSWKDRPTFYRGVTTTFEVQAALSVLGWNHVTTTWPPRGGH